MSATSDDRNPVEVLAEEFLERVRRGEPATPEQYAREHPALADEILALFPSLLMMEDLGGESEAHSGSTGTASGRMIGDATGWLGEYRLLREVGRGGMGVVYEAEQESLGRRVALKVLGAGALGDKRHVRRFHREARSAARLHHSNIVPVFGVGQQAGTHFYVMQFIQGQGLDAILAELKRLRDGRAVKPGTPPDTHATEGHAAADIARSMATGHFFAAGKAAPPAAAGTTAGATVVLTPTDEPETSPYDSAKRNGSSTSDVLSSSKTDRRYAETVARIGIQVAEALAYAHSQGILHRDIKPSNLLLDRESHVWVADFGLAKAVGAEDLTHTGDIVGTLRYMAPERFAGGGDARADVYSLGLTLYELLAFRPAFDESDRANLIRQVTQEDPPRLRKLKRSVPPDLETIIRKAIAREVGQRYSSAAALAEDLKRFVDGRPILARRVSACERLWWCKRNRAVATLLAFIGLLLFGVTAASLIAAAKFDRLAWLANERAAAESGARNREASHRAVAEVARIEAERQRDRAESALYAGRISQADLHYRSNNIHKSSLSLELCEPEPGRPDRRGWEWAYLHGLLHADLFSVGPLTVAFAGRPKDPQAGWIYALAFSPDGKRLAAGSEAPAFLWVEPKMTGQVKVWDLENGRTTLDVSGRTRSTTGLFFSSDGSTLAVGDDEAQIVKRLPTDAQAEARVSYWKASDGTPVLTRLRSRPIDFRRAARLEAKDLVIFDVSTDRELYRLPKPLPERWIRWVPTLDGRQLIGWYDGAKLEVRDIDDGRVLRSHDVSVPGPETLSVASADGRVVVAATRNRIELWDTATGRRIAQHRPPFRLNKAAVSRDGRFVAAGGFTDYSVVLLDAISGEVVFLFRGHTNAIQTLAFSPDATKLASGDWNGRVKVWDLTSPPGYRRIAARRALDHFSLRQGATGRLEAVRFTNLDGGYVETWDVDSGEQLTNAPVEDIHFTNQNPGRDCDLDSTGRIGACLGRRDRTTVNLIDTATGKVTMTLRGLTFQAETVASSPDGRRVVAVGESRPSQGLPEIEIVVWDAMTQAILGHWHEPETIPNRAMFTPDGRQVIVSGMRVAEARETLRAVRSLTLVYDAQTAANRRELVARDGAIGARIGLAVSPDGRTLATSGDASVLRFWDLEAGKLLREVESHSVEDLRYSPDGTRLAGANRSQVTIWNSATGEELLTLEIPGAEAGRAFNPVLAFSPDGKHLAARHSDGSILIWTGDASDQQAAAARHAAAERASGALFQLEHGLWLTRNGREDEAAAELKWAVDRQPSNAHYALTLKDFYINQQKWNDAVNLLERSLKRWSDRAWVPRSLGVVSALRGDFLKAMVWLARAAQIAPNDFSILTERLVAACGARDRAAVERLCDEALAAYETNHEPECRFQAAWHLVLTPPSSDSLRRAERLAAEIRPWHPAVVTKLELLQGTTAYRAGRYDAAVEILKRRPAQDVGRFVLAMAEHRLGQTKAARETFAKADAVLRQEFPESGPVKEADTRWCDWVVVNLVREEAKALLVGSEQIDNRK